MASKNQASVYFSKADNGNLNVEIINPFPMKGELSSTGKTFVVAYDSDSFGDLRVTVTVTRKNRSEA